MASTISYKKICTITLALLCTTSLAFSADSKVDEKDKNKKEIDVTKMEVNPDKLMKSYTKDPVLSGEAVDQKERNKVMQANEEKFGDMTVGHIEGLYKCKNAGDPKQVAACRKQAFKK